MDGRTGALLVACLLAGCGQRGTTIVTTKSSPDTATIKPAASAAALTAAKEFVAAAKAGNASAEFLTVEFKKIIGEPLTPAEREKGYSDASATEWLRVVGARLFSANVYETSVAFTFQLESGSLRLVNEDKKWKVDWFHAGRPDPATRVYRRDDDTKYFSADAFLDSLITRNWELCEACLTSHAKKSLAPALGLDPLGYNRGTLRSKLQGFQNGATAYRVVISGDKADVTLTGSGERNLSMTLTSGSRPNVWLINNIE